MGADYIFVCPVTVVAINMLTLQWWTLLPLLTGVADNGEILGYSTVCIVVWLADNGEFNEQLLTIKM